MPDNVDDDMHLCPFCRDLCGCDGGEDDCKCPCVDNDADTGEPDGMTLAKERREEEWSSS
jgi:hypothetical protein